MPRSFLVKKHEETRAYHSYKPRDLNANDIIVPDSIYAITPYTPSVLPLTVKVNNGECSFFICIKSTFYTTFCHFKEQFTSCSLLKEKLTQENMVPGCSRCTMLAEHTFSTIKQFSTYDIARPVLQMYSVFLMKHFR